MSWIKEAINRGRQIKIGEISAAKTDEAERAAQEAASKQQATELMKPYSSAIQQLMDELQAAGYDVFGPADGFLLTYDDYIEDEAKPQSLLTQSFANHADDSGTRHFCRSWWPFSKVKEGDTQIALIPLKNNTVELRLKYNRFSHKRTRILSGQQNLGAELQKILAADIEQMASR